MILLFLKILIFEQSPIKIKNHFSQGGSFFDLFTNLLVSRKEDCCKNYGLQKQHSSNRPLLSLFCVIRDSVLIFWYKDTIPHFFVKSLLLGIFWGIVATVSDIL